MMTPFNSNGLLLLAGLCCLLPRTKTDYHEGVYNDSNIDKFQCRKVALTISNVSISLYKEMAQESRNGNILFSPLRVIAALSMLSMGDQSNASQHILEALKLNKTGLPSAEIHKCFQYLLWPILHPPQSSLLRSGSSMFINQDINLLDEFLEGAKKLYLSDVIPISFTDSRKAKAQINNYIMKKTNREILDIIKSLQSDTSLVLVNYIIWNAKIISNFNCKFVKMEDFHLGHRNSIKIPMVNSVDVYHLFRVNDLFSMVLIYSHSQSILIYFIVPDKGRMRAAEQRLTYPHFRRMVQKLSLRMVKVHMPELSLSETHNLESVMNLLGINYVLSNDHISSVIMDDKVENPSKVISKVVLTFDDKGAIPSSTSCLESSTWANVPLFQLNRPFLIFIQDSDNYAPLFLGRVVHPRN
ncbi:alpha-1-antitrypsin 1-6-like isoform X1 [Acomys russatus]|uniref:alpha-1-antitrypsin 1-6-like isoform X1 n=1 Tax=Acomys russatus TaxID=60746 RepID=UPI0021E2F981|nr:alpha-1-antitrypsin 1-6-like isoform X1 [Acomys russatus]